MFPQTRLKKFVLPFETESSFLKDNFCNMKLYLIRQLMVQKVIYVAIKYVFREAIKYYLG